MFTFIHIIFSILIFIFQPDLTHSSRVAMKMVDAPISYGFNNDLIAANTGPENLVLSVPPMNFSGPSHLINLLGRCFNYTDDVYSYSFCPFHNVTQVEFSNRWNAYQGVLGVWQEWSIKNNTFYSMMMTNGDQCGDIRRSVEVILECNQTEEIRDVVEPSRCAYLMVFGTPLVCHRDSRLVYPRLPENLREKWDQLETDWVQGIITPKAYEEELRNIFIEAGFQVSKDKSIIDAQNESKNSISSLNECVKEVEELRNEIEGLKILIDLKAVNEPKRVPKKQ